MTRFEVISLDDVTLQERVEWFGYPMYEPDYCFILVENTAHGRRFVGRDGGEPEDQLLCRDWSWVVDEMNRLGSERDIAIREREEALMLAYIGEHRFPDLTWKARCEETVKDLRSTQAVAAELRQALERLLSCEGCAPRHPVEHKVWSEAAKAANDLLARSDIGKGWVSPEAYKTREENWTKAANQSVEIIDEWERMFDTEKSQRKLVELRIKQLEEELEQLRKEHL